MIKKISVINAQHKITIPKEIREQLNLEINDFLQWEINDNYIIIKPLKIIIE